MTTHLDDRSNPGDGAEAEHPGAANAPADGEVVAPDHEGPEAEIAPEAPDTVAAATIAAPSTTATTPDSVAGIGHAGTDDWDHPPAAPLRSPMPTQSALSRFGDVLVSPFGRHRRETMVFLSLVVLALLVWVAVTELLVAPGASQSILS